MLAPQIPLVAANEAVEKPIDEVGLPGLIILFLYS